MRRQSNRDAWKKAFPMMNTPEKSHHSNDGEYLTSLREAPEDHV
jgi:hypothetical protein